VWNLSQNRHPHVTPLTYALMDLVLHLNQFKEWKWSTNENKPFQFGSAKGM